jgi:hypothetical protein
MRLKNRYEIMNVEDQTFAVPMESGEGAFSGMIKLSRTAAVIFELLQDETSEEDIVEKMSLRFDAPQDILKADVQRAVSTLREKGLLTE